MRVTADQSAARPDAKPVLVIQSRILDRDRHLGLGQRVEGQFLHTRRCLSALRILADHQCLEHVLLLHLANQTPESARGWPLAPTVLCPCFAQTVSRICAVCTSCGVLMSFLPFCLGSRHPPHICLAECAHMTRMPPARSKPWAVLGHEDQIGHWRFGTGRSQHGVDLPAVMRLMVEEMRDTQVNPV